jgi:hypothetical protein
MTNVHIHIQGCTITVVALHSADEPPADLAAVVAAIAAALDRAGIRYTAREATFTLRHQPPPGWR